MPTQCKPISFAFQGCQGRKVTAAFDGGSITSNAGAVLLRAADRSIGLVDRVAACFTDHRDARLTEHSVRTLVAQRTMGIALGYEDLNDHDELRHDPLLALLSGKLEGRREGCAALAGKSTLNRLEHAPRGGKLGRYHKIEHDPEALQAVLLESFIDSWKGRPPSRLVLDIDATDDEVHGRQEGRSYHGYYGHYCFLPLYITCGGRPLFALLRPGNADPAGGVTGPLGCIVERLRQRWPGLKILLRADSAYAREELLAWCEDNGVDHVIGLARNSRLVERIGWELADAQAEADRRGRAARRFTEFSYATLTSWSRTRRVIAKAEHLPGKANPRFVVTSLPETFSARTVYERVYCPRGNMENAIKEQQLDLFSDRTSASRFAANQLRLLFSAFASILFHALRRALEGTRLARATAGTLRLKLLKIGARVTVSVRRFKVAMDSAHPSATVFARVHARLSG